MENLESVGGLVILTFASFSISAYVVPWYSNIGSHPVVNDVSSLLGIHTSIGPTYQSSSDPEAEQ